MIGGWSLAHLSGEIIGQRVRQNKITIGQALHQRARAEPVCAVVGKVRFADRKQPQHVAHQIVINPKAAHRVMHCGINPHRDFVGVLARNLFVNFEQISVALADRFRAKSFDCVGEIEINAAAAWPDPAAFVANFLGCAR